MTNTRMLLAIAPMVCLAAAGRGPMTWPLTEAPEMRYETHSNITPKQVADGNTPAFDVKVVQDEGASVLSIEGDEKRILTGFIYVGTRVRLPDRIPHMASVRLAFQRECTADNRAPGLTLHIFTPEGWNSLSQSAEEAKPKGRYGRHELLRSATIVSGREDSPDWTAWQSPNLAATLRQGAGGEVIVALGMAAMHTGATEWAKFRSPELVMENVKPKQKSRTAKYPPKEHRTLHTDEEVALARARCEDNASAQAIRDGLVSGSRFWMDKTDEEVRAIIPPADVPRAFNVSTRGCPVHGTKIYSKGTYPWRVEIGKPLKIICPIGGEEYPSNDFWAYYRSGFQNMGKPTGKYVDDGWGWKGPSGDIYWLVGYGCHWYWVKFTLPGVLNLSRAYLLTGDLRYARKTAVMLDRIAEIYPAMAYEHQSRYGFETGARYRGKILNHIWETGTVRTLSEAYDNIFDALKDGSPLEQQLGKPCKQIRNRIEANILEEAIECIQDGSIAGNFGMHQCALAMAAVVRETGPTKELMDWMLKQSGTSSASHEGIEYAFYNFIYKDGMPHETSPGYCFSWVANFVSLARVLQKAGYDFYEQPRFKAMLDAFLDLVCIGTYTPAIGDAGSLTSKWIGGSVPVYAAGFAQYGDVRFAHALSRLGALRATGLSGYDSLFEPNVVEQAKAAVEKEPAPKLQSRVLDGYGLGIVNNANDSVAASIYYGYKGGHGHLDRLNFSLFAHGQKMTPDLGYPDFMNALVPGIFSWSKNTVSHNCVVVNQHRQMNNVPGKVRGFMDAPGVRFIDVSADETYAETSTYRRALVLIDLGPDSAYLLDLFLVAGGEQHDYSLHGPLGSFEVVGGELTPPQKGTLAGPDVPYAHFYDDPVLANPKYRGSYGGYKGSGFQHLENVQRLAAGRWWAQWKLQSAPNVGLRLRILDQPGQELFVTDGRVSPTGKNDWVLKYLIARRKGEQLRSQYVALLEPFSGQPMVTDARRVPVDGPKGDWRCAVEVTHRGGVDVILYQPGPQEVSIPSAGLRTDATLCVARLTPDRRFASLYALNGTYATSGEHALEMEKPFAGTIAGVDYDKRQVRLRVDEGRSLPVDGALKGRPVTFSNDKHSCLYTVGRVHKDGDEYVVALNEPDIMTGKAQVAGMSEDAMGIRTKSAFAFRSIYPGMRAVNEAKTVSLRVESVDSDVIRLAEQGRAEDFTDANEDGVTDAWLCDFGPGDAFRIDSVAALAKVE